MYKRQAIVCEELPERLESNVTYIKVTNSAVALGFLASQWWGNPSRKLHLVEMCIRDRYRRVGGC